MKSKIIFAIALLFALNGNAQTFVPGYMKKDGTWVEGYYKTNPNKTIRDNFSTEGNYNPYTGKEGKKKNTEIYVDPYAEPTQKKKSKKSQDF